MTSNYQILFPVDFSLQCRAAVPYVADVVRRFRAKLHFLHCIDESDDFRLCHERAEQLVRFTSEFPKGRCRPQAIAHGDPAAAIVSYAKWQRVNAIIMPVRVHASAHGSPLGSVTRGVLQAAPCAVWIEAGNGKPHLRWSPVLCAIDLQAGSEDVLLYASSLAAQLHANLIVVHAVPFVAESTQGLPAHLPPGLSESVAKQRLKELFQKTNIDPEAVIRSGAVLDVVRNVAERVEAKLLVVGCGRCAGDAAGALGQNTLKLSINSVCAVVFCPKSGEAVAGSVLKQREQITQNVSVLPPIATGSA